MAQMTISGVDKSVKDGFKEISRKYDVPMSTVVKPALRQFLNERADDLPEYIEKDVAFEQLTNENRWRMRVMWFESNVRGFFDDALQRDISPDPEKVEWAFAESCREEIVEQAPERWQDGLEQYLEEELARYRVHYAADNPDESEVDSRDRDEVIEYACRHFRAGRADLAAEYAEKVQDNGNLPTGMSANDVISEARQATQDRNMDDIPLSADGGNFNPNP